jgi:hypothetical protein
MNTMAMPREYAAAIRTFAPAAINVLTGIGPGCAVCYKHAGRGTPCPSCAKVLGEIAKPVRTLECCVCGRDTKGRQWYNRDHGYGICASCGDAMIARNRPDEQVTDLAGCRGVHWDVA